MKKRLILLLFIITGLSLVGCKKDEPPVVEKPPVVETDELKTQREAAVKEVDGYVKNMAVYSSTNQAEIKKLIATAKTKIEEAKTEADIKAAVSAAKSAIDKLPTIEAEDLAKAIADARNELDSYVKLSDYSNTNQAKITKVIQDAKAAIEKCTKASDVTPLVASAKKEIDGIPTLATEALATMKAAAKVELEGYIQDKTLYSKKGLAEIERMIQDAKENIDAATEEAVITAILTDTKSDLDKVLTIEEEKIQNALDFKNGLFADTAGALDFVTLENNKLTLNSKNQGTVRLRLGTQDTNPYQVLDAKITPNYLGVAGSSFSIRFRAWDLSHGYLMKIYDDHIDIYSAVWSNDLNGTLETLLVHNEFGMKDNQEYHLQIIAHEWKKTVLINGECIFTIEEEERSVGYTYIETWQTGFILCDPYFAEPKDSATLKADYDELLWKECINQTEAEKLAAAKTNAKQELDDYFKTFDKSLYSQANGVKLDEALALGKENIDACTTIENVNLEVKDIKKVLAAIKTLEREAFDTEAIAKKTEIEEYITDVTLYSKANQELIAKIIRDGKLEIDACNSLEEMEEVLASVKTALDEVLTITEEEVERAKAFKNALVNETSGAIENYITTDGNQVIWNTKDVDSTIVRFGNQAENKWSVLDTKLRVDYRGEGSILTLNFRAWDTAINYKMTITENEILFYSRAGGIDTLLMRNAYGIENGKEVHLQILCHEWQKTVLLDGECIFSIEEGDKTVGRIFIETWKTGVTLINPTYFEPQSSAEMKEDYEDLIWAPCVNLSEFELLKENSKTTLDHHIFDLTLYSEENQQVIANILSESKKTIDACDTVSKVHAAVEDAIRRLNAVKTLEREQFEEDTTAAKKELDDYLQAFSSAEYSEANWAKLLKLIEDGKLEIDAVTSVDEIDPIVAQVKEAVDAVLTIVEEQVKNAMDFKNSLEEADVVLEHLALDGNKVVFDTKALDSTFSYIGTRNDSRKGASFDTNLIIDYAASSQFIIHFSAWDKGFGYKMIITENSIVFYDCDSNVEELYMSNAYGIENGKEVHLQILCYGWTKSVLLDGECIFRIESDKNVIGRTYFETRNTGVTFINPIYTEYATNLEFEAAYKTEIEMDCINQTELDLTKAASKVTLENHISDLSLYSETNQQVIATIISEAQQTIDACNAVSKVHAAVEDAIKRLNAVKTLEREQFDEDTTAAKKELDDFVASLDSTQYSDKMKAEMAKIVEEGKLEIDAVTTVDEIPAILEQTKQKLSSILTIEQEGALRAETFKNLMFEETEGALNNITTEGNKVIFNTKEPNNSTIVRIGSQDGKNHVALDTRIIADYNNTTWDSFTIRFRAWDTNDGYKMEIKDSSIVISKCKWGTDDEVVVEKNFGVKNGEETHLQILCSGWQKTVLINGQVVFSYSENQRTVGYTYIQTWETGLTFIDPVYTEYPDEASFMAEYEALIWKKEE